MMKLLIEKHVQRYY